MKKIFSIKHITVLTIVSVSLAAILNSCKRENISSDSKKAEDEIAAVIKATETRYGKVSTAVVYNVNKFADFIELDKNGNEIGVRKRNVNARTGCSFYNCAYAEANGYDISNFDERYLLYSVEVFAGCGTANGTSVKVTWDVSIPYTILDARQNNAAQLSKGRIRFVNNSGTVLFSYPSITPVSITSLGTDPNCSNDQNFRVTYVLNNVPDTYLSGGNNIECQLFAYTNCSLLPQKLTTWVQGVTFPGSSMYPLPCSRIDKLWINPSTGTDVSQCATVAGAYVTCPSPPAGFTRTTSQQVEYRKRVVASYDWNAQPSNTSPVLNGVVPPVASGGSSATVNSCCGVLYLKDMVQGVSSMGWLVRYRNVYTPTTGTSCPAIPTGTSWPLGSYTTEYWIY